MGFMQNSYAYLARSDRGLKLRRNCGSVTLIKRSNYQSLSKRWILHSHKRQGGSKSVNLKLRHTYSMDSHEKSESDQQQAMQQQQSYVEGGGNRGSVAEATSDSRSRDKAKVFPAHNTHMPTNRTSSKDRGQGGGQALRAQMPQQHQGQQQQQYMFQPQPVQFIYPTQQAQPTFRYQINPYPAEFAQNPQVYPIQQPQFYTPQQISAFNAQAAAMHSYYQLTAAQPLNSQQQHHNPQPYYQSAQPATVHPQFVQATVPTVLPVAAPVQQQQPQQMQQSQHPTQQVQVHPGVQQVAQGAVIPKQPVIPGLVTQTSVQQTQQSQRQVQVNPVAQQVAQGAVIAKQPVVPGLVTQASVQQKPQQTQQSQRRVQVHPAAQQVARGALIPKQPVVPELVTQASVQQKPQRTQQPLRRVQVHPAAQQVARGAVIPKQPVVPGLVTQQASLPQPQPQPEHRENIPRRRRDRKMDRKIQVTNPETGEEVAVPTKLGDYESAISASPQPAVERVGIPEENLPYAGGYGGHIAAGSDLPVADEEKPSIDSSIIDYRSLYHRSSKESQLRRRRNELLTALQQPSQLTDQVPAAKQVATVESLRYDFESVSAYLDLIEEQLEGKHSSSSLDTLLILLRDGTASLDGAAEKWRQLESFSDWVDQSQRLGELRGRIGALVERQAKLREALEIQEPSDNSCDICMERKSDRVLDCGHILCSLCLQGIQRGSDALCHICRAVIKDPRNIFLP